MRFIPTVRTEAVSVVDSRKSRQLEAALQFSGLTQSETWDQPCRTANIWPFVFGIKEQAGPLRQIKKNRKINLRINKESLYWQKILFFYLI